MINGLSTRVPELLAVQSLGLELRLKRALGVSMRISSTILLRASRAGRGLCCCVDPSDLVLDQKSKDTKLNLNCHASTTIVVTGATANRFSQFKVPNRSYYITNDVANRQSG